MLMRPPPPPNHSMKKARPVASTIGRSHGSAAIQPSRPRPPRNLPAIAAPEQKAAETAGAFNPYVVLRSGIQSNQEGAYVEASRTLNGALSRLDNGIPAATRAEFELEAALADSNIGQKASAEGHFTAAESFLASSSTGAVSAFLQRKASTYRALDATNRRQWSQVLTDLRAGETTGNPLNDPGPVATATAPRCSGFRPIVPSNRSTSGIT